MSCARPQSVPRGAQVSVSLTANERAALRTVDGHWQDEISQGSYGEIESCSAAANSSLPLPPERLSSVAFGGKLSLFSSGFTRSPATCGGRAHGAEVSHNSSAGLRCSRLIVVVHFVSFRRPGPSFFGCARRLGMGALKDEAVRVLVAELPGKKVHFDDRDACECALPSLLRSLFRLPAFATLLRVRTLALLNRVVLSLLSYETREFLAFTKELYAFGSPSTSADGAGRTPQVFFAITPMPSWRLAISPDLFRASSPSNASLSPASPVRNGTDRKGAPGVVSEVADECVWLHVFSDRLPSSTCAPPQFSPIRVTTVSEASSRKHPNLVRAQIPLPCCVAEKVDAG